MLLRALIMITGLLYRPNLAALSRALHQYYLVGILATLSIAGCGGHVYHVVEPGESLYSIGWAYGYDYRQVAKWNRLTSPYSLNPGQRLRVAPPLGYSAAPVVEATGVKKRVAVDDKSRSKSGNASGGAKGRVNAAVSATKELFSHRALTWRWPTRERRVLRTYSSKDATRQGLDIAGEQGNPIYAAAAGRVVYAGSGLARYGRLIIVKHSEKYLSAYAHNYKLHVKEGEVVKAGQRIADMGSTGSYNGKKRAKLHFEIRRNGKPVDPMRFLPR
jgi:lipoprotein NlpD